MRRLIRSASLAAAAFASAMAVANAAEIGSVAAVNRDIEGTPPGAAARALLLGDRLITNERLISSDQGSGQMLFLDQTTLTVSPNSEIVLDKYVYDPDTETGEIGLSIARGVLRVVGGRITKNSDGVVRTPTATIGIRGGIAVIAVGDDGARVMHVAGEYTTVTSNGQTLTMSRSNALASIGGDGPVYEGVASEDEIADLFDQTQGGGGGAEDPPTEADAEGSGVAELNSEDPNSVFDPPISTAGESPANDQSAETEQLNLATDSDIQTGVLKDADPDQNSPVGPDDPVDPVNPFASFIGGAVIVGRDDGFVDEFGDEITDPVAQNFLFTDDGVSFDSVREGSIIGVLSTGGAIRFPAPDQAGVFSFGFNQTASPVGRLAGTGVADPDNGLFGYYFNTQDDRIGVALFAEPGPGQLRDLNSDGTQYRITPFEVLPDFHVTSSATAAPFLPAGFADLSDNGATTKIFLISPPGAKTFGPGFGFDTSTGTRALLPYFSVNGTGPGQRYLMFVGASSVLNSGDDLPALTLFTRGSFRPNASVTPFRVQSSIGSTVLDQDGQKVAAVFGAGDNYLLLGNSGPYFGNDEDPEEEEAVSFLSNIDTGETIRYGNTHLARRGGAQFRQPNARISVGATPADYVNVTGLTGAGQFGVNEIRLLSHGFGANIGALRAANGSIDKATYRTVGFANGSVRGGFLTQKAGGSIVIGLDEVFGQGEAIFGATLAFGGGKSAVIDDAFFGMREHNNPGSLQNILSPPGVNGNQFDTVEGPLSGRPPNANGETAFRGALLSHGFANAASLYPANTPLTPEYLTWGWWTGQFRFANGDPGAFDNARVQYSLGTWVAGDRTAVLPASGFATYNGPVTVNNLTAAGADFLDGGRFQMTWDFAERIGDAQFQNVLNLPNFTVPVDDSIAMSTGNDYSGFATVGPGADPADVFVDGAFFDGPNNNDARATAGSIAIQNGSGSISAVGTFWGER